MGRVAESTISNINKFFDWWFTEHPESEGKCTLCNETLTHIVKKAEVEADAATATVTNELAKRINQDATPQDQVSGDQLRGRVQRNDGTICTNHANNPDPAEAQLSLNLDATREEIEELALTDEDRREQSGAASIVFTHLFNPIDALTTCPANPARVYSFIESFSMKRLDKLDDAIAFLAAIKKVHTEVQGERD